MKIPVLGWRQKLIVTSLLCLVLPSLITLILTGVYTKDELRSKASAKAEQAMGVADLYVSNLIRDMINAFNGIQYDSEMITYLRVAYNKYSSSEPHDIDFFSYKQIAEKLDHLSFFGGQTYITIMLPNGLLITNYSTYNNDMSSLYGQGWVRQLLESPVNTTFWTGLQPNYIRLDADRNPNLVTIARTFQLYANSPNALIILSKPEEQFRQVFAQYAADPLLMLVDPGGTIISHTDKDQVGLQLRDTMQETDSDVVKWQGQEYISTTRTLSYGVWSLRSLTPSRSVTARISNLFNYVSILQILFFLLFSLVLFYLLRQLTKPIMRLSRTASKVEMGDLNVRSHVSGDDEIGHLGLAFDRMLDQVKAMIRQVETEQNRKRMAELELLQAQINPHFLFNTLNSIRLHALLKEEEEIAATIGSLSTLLRMTINRNNEFVPLHEEVDTVEQYMRLMNFRHQDHVRLTTNLASDTLLECIPRFTLQPLIENAYIHGLQQKNGEISISAWRRAHLLVIRIADDGVGMTASKLLEVRQGSPISGIGIKNVNERLKIIYGEPYGMELESAPGQGLAITLTIPLNGGKESAHVQGHTGG
ncbi:sensor histidine kinase [Paenibacillus athensensis]|nr:histidine kinase [Paenibacillus athensensis]MCD1259887.1 sensor histidine kinase [Paenibacillus athensensis]